MEHLFETLKIKRNILYYLILFVSIILSIIYHESIIFFLINMPIWRKMLYIIAVAICLYFSFEFWYIELFKWEHITYEYINLISILIRQSYYIILSLLLAAVDFNINNMVVQNIIFIIPYVFMVLAIFWCPCCYIFMINIDE